MRETKTRIVHLTLPRQERTWCGINVNQGVWWREETRIPEDKLQGSGWKLCSRCLRTGVPE